MCIEYQGVGLLLNENELQQIRLQNLMQVIYEKKRLICMSTSKMQTCTHDFQHG